MASKLALSGIFDNGTSGAIATLIGITTLLGGAGRYGAVLARRPEAEVERATAFGFLVASRLGASLF